MRFPSRISLVGFMGSGKSTVGPLIALKAGLRFFDSDKAIEARAGALVADIFKDQGETFFREIEAQAISELLNEERCVIATGGGAFAQAACAEDLLARSFTVYLHCELDEALRRAAGQGGRPLLEGEKSGVLALYEKRKAKYSRAHATVDTTHRSPEDVAGDVLRLLPPP